MSRRVNAADYGQSRPKLGVEQLDGADSMVLIVSAVDPEVIFEERKRCVLTFAEFPELAYWVNVTGLKALIERLGDDVDNWIGKKVPLIRARTNNPQTKQSTTVLWVAPAEEWDEVLDADRQARRPAASGPKARGKARR